MLPNDLNFEVTVVSFGDVHDGSLRGTFTVYEIRCDVRGRDGAVHTFSAGRRYSEWRKLHEELWLGSRAFPVPRRLRHGDSAKRRRAEALQNW